MIAFEEEFPGGIDIVLYDMDAELGCRIESDGLSRNASWAPHGWEPPAGD